MASFQSSLFGIDPLLLAGACILAGYLASRFAFRERPIGRFLCQIASFGGLTVMLLAAGVIPYAPTPTGMTGLRLVLVSGLKITWWLAGSWLLAGFVHAFVAFERLPKETRLVQDLIVGLIYLGAIFAIIGYGFDLPINALLATSGAIALVIGLALQSTLGDVFSGIVLNFAKPYRPGDWIILDKDTQGKVVETNWRGTVLLSKSNDLSVIPNSMIAKAKVTNASRPTSAHGLSVHVRLDPKAGVATCQRVLEAAVLNCNHIVHMPAPSVMAVSVDATAIEFEIYIYIPTVTADDPALNELFDLFVRHCRAAGIEFAPPSDVVTVKQLAVQDHATETSIDVLHKLAFLAPLTDAERESLAKMMKRHTYEAGSTITNQGDVLESLLIISAGVVLATEHQADRDIEILRLGPGDCFGEGGVMTGAASIAKITALTDAVLYEISRQSLTPILKQRPTVLAALAEILAQRMQLSKFRLEHRPDQDAKVGVADWIADRARSIFHLS